MRDIRIVFMGTADFSKAVLEMLLENHYHVVAVVSQPDRPVGRKKILKPTMVKEVAMAHGIDCVQVSNIKKQYEEVLAYQPDLVISAAYGQIVPEALLKAPRLGCINVHASLLPKLRGGAPVHHAIIDGYDRTGVTIMYMAKKMDAGDMLAKIETPISDQDTVETLYARLTQLGANLLKEMLPDFLAGKIIPEKQNEDEVTYAPTIDRETEHVDFNQKAVAVDRLIRGLNSWPVAYARLDDGNVKLWAGTVTTTPATDKPGTIVQADHSGVYVCCQDYLYRLDEVQVAGKKKMPVKDLMNGRHPFTNGKCFQ